MWRNGSTFVPPVDVFWLLRHHLSTYGRRAFAVAGPTVWNFHLDNLLVPDVT